MLLTIYYLPTTCYLLLATYYLLPANYYLPFADCGGGEGGATAVAAVY